jgi:hypothetical protein
MNLTVRLAFGNLNVKQNSLTSLEQNAISAAVQAPKLRRPYRSIHKSLREDCDVHSSSEHFLVFSPQDSAGGMFLAILGRRR